MSILNLIGFTSEEVQSLQRRIPGLVGKVQQESSPILSLNEILVVCVTVAKEIADKKMGTHPTVLWVPEGREPLPVDAWADRFAVQLREDDEDDCILLERLSRCIHVLEWNDRVEDIVAEWFSRLTESPRLCEITQLPFDKEELGHLTECDACRDEAYDRLQQRAELRWTMLCPSVDEIGDWLEALEENSRLEEHVVDCALCQETVKRQAWLWQGAGFLTGEQVNAKFRKAGIRIVPAVWLTAAIVWQQMQINSSIARAALFATMLSRYAALRPASRQAVRRSGGTSEEAEISPEEVEANTRIAGSLSLVDPEHWVDVKPEGDDVLVRAGRSAKAPYQQFVVTFRQGDKEVVVIRAVDGVVRLTPAHFETAQRAHTDRFAINPLQ